MINDKTFETRRILTHQRHNCVMLEYDEIKYYNDTVIITAYGKTNKYRRADFISILLATSIQDLNLANNI